MRKLLLATLMFWGMGAVISAAVLQDWSTLDVSKDAGTFADSKGSKISFSLVPGPNEGQKALQISANLTDWGGVWATLGKDLSKVKALKFKAKSSAPTYLMVGLNDDQKVQAIAISKSLRLIGLNLLFRFPFSKRHPGRRRTPRKMGSSTSPRSTV